MTWLAHTFGRSGYFPIGTSLAIRSKGSAEVPSFDGKITIPPALEGFDDNITKIVDRQQDFTLTWKPVDATVTVVVDQEASIACRFDGKAGIGIVDHSLFTGFGTKSALVMGWSSTTTAVQENGMTLSLVANNGASAWFTHVD